MGADQLLWKDWLLQKFQPKFQLQGTIKFIKKLNGGRIKPKGGILGRLRKEEQKKINRGSSSPMSRFNNSTSNANHDQFIDLENQRDNLESEIMGLRTNPKKSITGSVYSKQVPRSENNRQIEGNVEMGYLKEHKFKKTHVKQRSDILNQQFKNRNRTYNCAKDSDKNQQGYEQAKNMSSLYGQKSFLSTDKHATYGKLKVRSRDDQINGMIDYENEGIGVIRIGD